MVRLALNIFGKFRGEFLIEVLHRGSQERQFLGSGAYWASRGPGSDKRVTGIDGVTKIFPDTDDKEVFSFYVYSIIGRKPFLLLTVN